MIDLLIASHNRDKVREFQRLLKDAPVRAVDPEGIGLAIEVPEPHQDYAQNAADKALAYCRASGLPAVADDSGIEVAALGGQPGPLSARWGAGEEDPVDALLRVMAHVSDRRARMICWLALAIPGDGRSITVESFRGAMDGSVADDRQGSGGFGYDPVFLLPEGITTAQLSDADKDARSHRGHAVRAMLPRLEELARVPKPA